VASSVNEVIESRRDGVLTLRLNQPEVRNALGPAMVRALYAALLRAREDASVAAVIITAGADLREFLADRPPVEHALERRQLGALFLLIETHPRTLIAAVNGDALGAGLGLVAACHLAVAVKTARFGLPGVRLGIMPMTIMPALFLALPRKLGMEIMLTGRWLTAEEARSAGLVNRTVEARSLETTALSLAKAANGAASLPRLTRL